MENKQTVLRRCDRAAAALRRGNDTGRLAIQLLVCIPGKMVGNMNPSGKPQI